MAYVSGNSFTTVSAVEAYCGRGSFTSGTTPTADMVLEFMATEAGTIELTLQVNGITYTVPTGSNPIPDGPLALLCNQMNAVGAAIHTVTAFETGIAPAQSEKVNELIAIYKALEERLVNLLKAGAKKGLFGSTPQYTASSVTTGGIEPIDYPPSGNPGPSQITVTDNQRNW